MPCECATRVGPALSWAGPTATRAAAVGEAYRRGLLS